MILRFESHVHTNFSDGYYYKFMIRSAFKKRIDVLAITDHNTQEGFKYFTNYVKEYSKKNGQQILIMPAEEIGCEGGEILAYGLTETIKRGTSISEAVDNIHDQGGVAAMAHPFSFLTSITGNSLKQYPYDGIEIINLNSFDLSNNLAKKFALTHPNLFQIGGNDAHHPWCLGIILNLIESEPEIDAILKALKKKKIRIIHGMESFPWRTHFYIKNYLPNLFNVIRTGIGYQTNFLYKKYKDKKRKQKKL
ncbi:MAG TPA: PHP-associated domain-containing protein [Candidatus Deferrimicrobium sp.]|nr:PHP-associated domain-containing protein [Candidatus Deferrimicrobium sp.]